MFMAFWWACMSEMPQELQIRIVIVSQEIRKWGVERQRSCQWGLNTGMSSQWLLMADPSKESSVDKYASSGACTVNIVDLLPV